MSKGILINVRVHFQQRKREVYSMSKGILINVRVHCHGGIGSFCRTFKPDAPIGKALDYMIKEVEKTTFYEGAEKVVFEIEWDSIGMELRPMLVEV